MSVNPAAAEQSVVWPVGHLREGCSSLLVPLRSSLKDLFVG